MAVTRIHTNQMADGIVTNAKIADATIQGGKLADDITYGSNITVSGNLTVNGTTTTIDTVNTTIDDPILLLGANQTGSGAVDLGIMGERGDDTNVFIGYDESANEFIAVETSSLDSATTIAVSDYSNMHVGGLTAEDNAAVTGSITGGSITTAGTLNADGATTLADLTIDASSTIDMGDNKITNVADPTEDGDVATKGYVDTNNAGVTIADSSDISTANTSSLVAGDTMKFIPTANETDITVSSGTDITNVTIGLVDSPTVTGTITGGTLTDGTLSINSGAVTGGTTATFTGAVTAGSFTTAGTLNADGATTLGDVTIDASSTLDMGDNKVTNVTDPTADQDAATKGYIDGLLSSGFTVSDSEDTPNTSVVANGDTLTFVPTANETTVIVGTDSVTIGLPDDVTIAGNLEVEGNIVVNGTTTTVNSTVTAVVDPILQLGRGTDNSALTSDDAKDRGVSMYYYEGSEKLAFMGFDTTSNDFRYYSDASITDEVVTGTLGSGVFGALTVDNVTIDGRQVTSNDTNGNLELAANGTGKVTVPTGNELVVTDLDDTGIVFSSSGELTTDSNFTYDGTDIGLGGDFTVVNITATGTITGDTITDGTLTITDGSITGAVNITASGEITGGSVTVGDLTATRVTFAGTGGDLTDDAELTYATATNTLSAGNITSAGTITGGTLTDGTISINGGAITGATDLTLSGTLTAGTITDGTASLTSGAWTGITTLTTSGEATLASAIVSDLTDNRITIAGTSGALEDDANLTWNGTTMLIGGATATTGATLKVSATDSLMVPVGTTAERPTGVAGMLRYNSTLDQYEGYDVGEGEFIALGIPAFTVIASETFDGDDSTVAFTLSDSQTTASCVVSVNGVVQLPTTAYAVSGTTLTFTEAPATSDKIEVRKLTTTTQVQGLASNGGETSIDTGATEITVKGDLIPETDDTYDLGSTSKTWTNVYAEATSALYADLAEKYEADADYEAGTVLAFGGDKEVTECADEHTTKVAGVVSTAPGYRMNDGLEAEHTAMVALTGRVPTKVTGPVAKGDMMVSAGNGMARAEANPTYGAVIGKALENWEGGEGVIEVVIK